ncbi:MAG: hypothetical protein MUF54_19055 [Polyangiaceae bacterium]|nr:hypothetical protein [Polyangiaceae bacterium]
MNSAALGSPQGWGLFADGETRGAQAQLGPWWAQKRDASVREGALRDSHGLAFVMRATGVTLGAPCGENYWCPDGTVCVQDLGSYYCTPLCTSENPVCPMTFECSSEHGACFKSRACGPDNECAPGMVCVDDGGLYCTRRCGVTLPCPGGYACAEELVGLGEQSCAHGVKFRSAWCSGSGTVICRLMSEDSGLRMGKSGQVQALRERCDLQHRKLRNAACGHEPHHGRLGRVTYYRSPQEGIHSSPSPANEVSGARARARSGQDGLGVPDLGKTGSGSGSGST